METDGYRIRDQSKPHFLTFTVVHWTDVFTRKTYKDVIIESLQYCIEHKGMILYGYVIMSNHMHLIAQSNYGDLSGLIRDFKKFTASKILSNIKFGPESRREWMLQNFEQAASEVKSNEYYRFWRYGNHPEEIYSHKFLWSKLDYVHLNPVRGGIVSKASHYLYSSASNYVDNKGLVDVTLASNPVVNVHSFYEFWKSLAW